MLEQLKYTNGELKFSLRILGTMIILINLFLGYIALLIMDNKSGGIITYIFIFFQNTSVFALSIVFMFFFLFEKYKRLSIRTEGNQHFVVYFMISIILVFIAIVSLIYTIQILEPTIDPESVTIRVILVILCVVTMLNLIFFMFGVKSFIEWLEFQLKMNIPKTMILAIKSSIISAFSIIFLCSLGLFMQINSKFFDSDFFNTHYLLIPLFVLVPIILSIVGFFFVGIVMDVVAGYELIVVSKKQRMKYI